MPEAQSLPRTLPVRASSIAGTGRSYYDIVEDLADLMFEAREAGCTDRLPDLPFQAFWGHFFLDSLQDPTDDNSSAFYHYVSALQGSLSRGDELRGDAVQHALEEMELDRAAAAHRDVLPLYGQPLDEDQIRPTVDRLEGHVPGATDQDLERFASWLARHPGLVGVARARRADAVKAWMSGETIRAEDWA